MFAVTHRSLLGTLKLRRVWGGSRGVKAMLGGEWNALARCHTVGPVMVVSGLL